MRISSSEITICSSVKTTNTLKIDLITSDTAVESHTTIKTILLREFDNICWCICELSKHISSKREFTIHPRYPFLHFELAI
jgi:hypothetical protein